jgi:hypothetical protein
MRPRAPRPRPARTATVAQMTTPCPTCAFAVPDGAPKCPQCGRVFGEANRCPHCHAIAAVRPSGPGFVCSACGKPRTLEPGTTIAGLDPNALASPRRRGLRLLGGFSMSLAILGAALATALLGTGGAGIAVAIAVGSVGAFVGVRFLQRADAAERAMGEQLAKNRVERARVMLIERTATVAELAAALGTSEDEADRIATSLAAEERDGIRAELDEDVGVVRYGRRRALAPVRVEDPDAEVPEEERQAATSARRQGQPER